MKLLSQQTGTQAFLFMISAIATILLLGSSQCQQKAVQQVEASADSVFRFGSWNVENLFDTKNDAWNDDDFTPDGANRWTKDRYENKLNHLSEIIASMHPDVLGLCEIEKAAVIQDLIHTKPLKSLNFGYVHYDSPDERGIDVALIYRKDKTEIIHSEPIAVALDGGDKTRDLLYVQIRLKQSGDTIHYFVNHWPSRREGRTESEAKRMKASNTLRSFLEQKHLLSSPVIICGDFNDNPYDSSIRYGLKSCRPGKNASCDLLNLSALLNQKQDGSLKFGKRWDLFDQILISGPLWNSTSTAHCYYRHYSISVFKPEAMVVQEGKQKDAPFRTFAGKEYTNGYSDHFPVFAELNYE